jgi:hypothetical protein
MLSRPITYGNNAPAKVRSIFRHGSFQASTTVQMRIALFCLTLEDGAHTLWRNVCKIGK